MPCRQASSSTWAMGFEVKGISCNPDGVPCAGNGLDDQLGCAAIRGEVNLHRLSRRARLRPAIRNVARRSRRPRSWLIPLKDVPVYTYGQETAASPHPVSRETGC